MLWRGTWHALTRFPATPGGAGFAFLTDRQHPARAREAAGRRHAAEADPGDRLPRALWRQLQGGRPGRFLAAGPAPERRARERTERSGKLRLGTCSDSSTCSHTCLCTYPPDLAFPLSTLPPISLRLPSPPPSARAPLPFFFSPLPSREPSSEETEAALFGSPAAYLARAVASGYALLLRRPLLEHPDGRRVQFLLGSDTPSFYG